MGDIMKKLFLTLIIAVLLSGLTCLSPANALDLENPARLNSIIMTLLIPEIQSAVNEFYAPYLTIQPTVVAFLGSKIVGIDGGENSSHYTVTVEIFPYIGPHISVGSDRLMLYISPLGNVTVKNFEHLESAYLPWNLQPALKKPLP
jgi:hypothetical protein